MNKILAKADKVFGQINRHPYYDLQKKNELSRMILEESWMQSVSLDELVNGDGIDLDKHDSKVTNALWNAWDYLLSRGLDIGSMTELGSIIEPSKHKKGPKLRTDHLQIFGIEVCAPDKIHYKIDEMLGILEYFDGHPLDKGIEAHIRMARMQPYKDGNKRAGRLIQNFCLHEKSYPAVLVPASEYGTYGKLLKDTILDRANQNTDFWNQSESEVYFRQYMSAKMLATLEHTKSELDKSRCYTIHLSGACGKREIKSTMSALRALAGHPNCSGIDVNNPLTERGHAIVRVVGDVDLIEVEHALESGAGKRTKYKVQDGYWRQEN